jgi:hypothetical protein
MHHISLVNSQPHPIDYHKVLSSYDTLEVLVCLAHPAHAGNNRTPPRILSVDIANNQRLTQSSVCVACDQLAGQAFRRCGSTSTKDHKAPLALLRAASNQAIFRRTETKIRDTDHSLVQFENESRAKVDKANSLANVISQMPFYDEPRGEKGQTAVPIG